MTGRPITPPPPGLILAELINRHGKVISSVTLPEGDPALGDLTPSWRTTRYVQVDESYSSPREQGYREDPGEP